jgi:uncharacterized coiled-coil protein SlyX
MKTKTMTTLHLKKSMCRSPLRLAFFLIPLVLACFALAPASRAFLPPPAPDGGYPNGNTAEGSGALFSLTSGSDNTANGFEALSHNTTGGNNTANGFAALSSNTTGGGNTATGLEALAHNTTASGNTATGLAALFNNTTGGDNTANGFGALNFNKTGINNTANGFEALFSNTTGSRNMADGDGALFANTTGGHNVAVGNATLFKNKVGNYNIDLGYSAGWNLTTGNNNIDIGNPGVASELNTIRIGSEVASVVQDGSTQAAHTATFIAGIHGVTVASGLDVVVGSNGQLGTITSSARFKEAIKPMDKASEAILALQPVTFRYKHELDPDGVPQFGLVAEQVEKVNPDLVVRDADGKVNTVRYEAVNAMLLNEFLKERRKVEGQQATITRLESKLAKQELTAAQQQKQIETLTATVQKVSDQIALSKPAPQLVANP